LADISTSDAAKTGGPNSQTKIVVPPPRAMVSLLGSADELLRVVEHALRSDIHVRGNEITISGAPADNAVAADLFNELLALLDKGEVLTVDSVRRTAGMLASGGEERPAEVLTLNILSRRGRTIRPKTLNQIILTRPAVEAGERLGFLPGTLYDKIDPYLRPLYDALHDMVDPESIPRLIQAGTIEVAPLAYMRGRTLNDAFIILDEAQNTSAEQMKMFLTRLGFGARMVVTGDVTQVDLPSGTRSGLRVVREILDGVEDVHFSLLNSSDVVRHRLVSDIVDAYARWDETNDAPAPVSRGRRQRGG